MKSLFIATVLLSGVVQAKTYSTYKIKNVSIECTPRGKQSGDLKINKVKFFYNANSSKQVRVTVDYLVKGTSKVKYTIKNCQVSDKGTPRHNTASLVTFEITACEMDSRRFFTDDPELRTWFWYEGQSGHWRNGGGTIAYAGLFNNISMSCNPIGRISTSETKHQIKEDERTDERTTEGG